MLTAPESQEQQTLISQGSQANVNYPSFCICSPFIIRGVHKVFPRLKKINNFKIIVNIIAQLSHYVELIQQELKLFLFFYGGQFDYCTHQPRQEQQKWCNSKRKPSVCYSTIVKTARLHVVPYKLHLTIVSLMVQ